MRTIAWLSKLGLCGCIAWLGVGAWTHGYHVGGVVLVIVGVLGAVKVGGP